MRGSMPDSEALELLLKSGGFDTLSLTTRGCRIALGRA
jgi:hypothetical protein